VRRWCLSNQRADQIAFTYAPDGYSVLAEVNQTLVGATTVANTTETVYLPTASGPMPVVALINGEPFAVYTDHLNTPRRLTDAQDRPRWQWAFSGFGKQAAQSIPRANLPTIQYSLRYPGQVDDGNGLFYNFNRFYDPLAGRYTQADPIGLEGGWNRFGYVGGNAISYVDPTGEIAFLPVLIWGAQAAWGAYQGYEAAQQFLRYQCKNPPLSDNMNDGSGPMPGDISRRHAETIANGGSAYGAGIAKALGGAMLIGATKKFGNPLAAAGGVAAGAYFGSKQKCTCTNE
jgi:RHS repeat-associated protein